MVILIKSSLNMKSHIREVLGHGILMMYLLAVAIDQLERTYTRSAVHVLQRSRESDFQKFPRFFKTQMFLKHYKEVGEAIDPASLELNLQCLA